MKTILVDDEAWMIKHFLYETQGMADISLIGTFRNPLKALNFAEGTSVDLAFLDVEMPEMNGLTLAQKLRELYPEMIIIFISAYESYVAKAIQDGADYFVMKPYCREELQSVISRAKLLSGRLKKQIVIRTFGNFDLFVAGTPIDFLDVKTKELMAYLTDKRGGTVSADVAAETLFPDLQESEQKEFLQNTLANLRNVLKDNNIEEILCTNSQGIYLKCTAVECDYLMYLDGDIRSIQQYTGNYLEEYKWANSSREALERQKTLLDKSKDAIQQNTICACIRYVDDEPRTITYMNDSFLAITGYNREDINNKFHNSLRALINRNDYDAMIKEEMQKDPEEEFRAASYRIVTQDNTTTWVMENGKRRKANTESGGKTQYESVLVDISGIKAVQEKLEVTASRDALTGLLNRGSAKSGIESYIEGEKEDGIGALVLMDIDNFKHVNDTYGHPFADTVLTDVASILKRSVRTSDIVGRIGGDEMLIFLEEVNSIEHANTIMEKVLSNLRRRLSHKTPNGEITCSFGVAMYPDDGRDFQTLYEQADSALYVAKEKGKDGVVFFQNIVMDKV